MHGMRLRAGGSNHRVGDRVVSTVTFVELQEVFQLTKAFSTRYKGYATKISAEKRLIQKSFRTRVAKNWRSLIS